MCSNNDLELALLFIVLHVFKVIVKGTPSSIQLVAVLQQMSLLHIHRLYYRLI